MKPLRCALNKTHRMYYEEFGIGDIRNGFYCKQCGYMELDRDLTDDMLQFQEQRKVD